MQIELYIDGKKNLFTAPFVPMLAKRKFLEIEAKAENREEPLTKRGEIEEYDEVLSILSDVVFNGQFTVEQLYAGASKKYADEKLMEAVFGIKPKKKDVDVEGNEQGK